MPYRKRAIDVEGTPSDPTILRAVRSALAEVGFRALEPRFANAHSGGATIFVGASASAMTALALRIRRGKPVLFGLELRPERRVRELLERRFGKRVTVLDEPWNRSRPRGRKRPVHEHIRRDSLEELRVLGIDLRP